MQNRAAPPKAAAVLAVLGGLVALWTGGTAALVALAEPPPLARPRPRAAPRASPQAALPLTPLPRSLEALRALHASVERPRPDARLLLAFAELARRPDRPIPAVTATDAADHWVVAIDGRPTATLPDHATPADALPALARLLGEQPPSPPDDTAPRHVVDVAPGDELAALRALGGRPDAVGAATHPAAAARALAALLHGTYDAIDGTDLLAARTLAAAAWARAVGTPAPDAEALAAWQMGYHTVAKALAAPLGEDDPVRAFVHGDCARLDASPARPRRDYLRFRALASEGDPAARPLLDAMSPSARASLAVAGWRPWTIDRGDFGASLASLRVAPVEALVALEHEAGVRGAREPRTGAELLSRAGALLGRHEAPARWVDDALVGARVHAAMWSGLERSIDAELDRRSDADAAASLVADLRAGESPTFRPMLAWFDARVANGRGEPRALAAAITGTDPLPGLLRLNEADRASVLGQREGLVRLAAHLDARVSHSYHLLGLVEHEELDPAWHRALCRAVALEPELPADDLAGCRLRDADAPPAAEDPAAVEARFREQNAHAESWMDSRAEYGRWLIAQHRAAETVALAQAWLATHREGLEPAFARTGMARAQLALGDPEAAWATIAPAVDTWQGGAMHMAVAVLIARGRLDEARPIAARLFERYHDTEEGAALAEVLWRQGQPEPAARALASLARRPHDPGWRHDVGGALARAFGAQPPASIAAAGGAMAQAGISADAIEALAMELAPEHAALALALHEPLRAPGLRGLALLATRHRLIAAARSREEADRWITATVPPSARGPIAQFAFGEENDALVWLAADSAQDDEDATAYLWLLRAAALLRAPPDPARRARVEAALAAPTRPYHHLARHLLGLETREQALALADSDARAAEVAYWVGYRAHCEGRLEEAADWYRLVARRGPATSGEAHWAATPLRRWSRAPRWLDRIADPWAQAHAGDAAPAPGDAAPAPGDAPPAVDPPADRHHGRHHRDPGGGHHRSHHRHRSQRSVEGGRS